MFRLPLNLTITEHSRKLQRSAICQSGGNAFRKNRIEEEKEVELCPRCRGKGKLRCQKCRGTGTLPRGGYHKFNRVNVRNVVGKITVHRCENSANLASNWTAMESTFGWRHFTVIDQKKSGSQTFVLMSATCEKDTQFWVNVRNLRDRSQWSTGWLRKSELELFLTEGGTACHLCSQTGWISCPVCNTNPSDQQAITEKD